MVKSSEQLKRKFIENLDGKSSPCDPTSGTGGILGKSITRETVRTGVKDQTRDDEIPVPPEKSTWCTEATNVGAPRGCERHYF